MPTQTNTQNTAHTPGPWRFNADLHEVDNITPTLPFGSPRRRVATVHGYDAEYEANARLIAAVPRMLYALQIAELHLSVADDKCADAATDGTRCLECLGCSVDMARSEVRKALTEAGSGPL